MKVSMLRNMEEELLDFMAYAACLIYKMRHVGTKEE